MGLIDRILSGEFDEEKDSVQGSKVASAAPIAGKSKITDPDEDEDELDDEDTPRDDFEDLPTEDVEDSTNYDDGTPDEDFMKEYTLEHGIPVFDETDLVGAAPAQYVEMPKQSKVREINKNKSKNMTDTNNNTTDTNTPAPKQSTAKTATTKKRGAPHKLAEHTEEVCRLYNENVGAKLIAEKFGVSVTCVINTLKRAGVAIRPKGRRKTAE